MLNFLNASSRSIDFAPSFMDEYLREQMQDELSNMLAMLDKPAILVSHSSKEVENLCDKKYHIQRGHMEKATLL